jgi:hypothetical protein
VRGRLANYSSRQIATCAALALGAALLAYLIPTRPTLPIGIAMLLLLLGFVLSAPSLLLAAVFATTFAPWRVGPSAVDMSICDAVTILAMLAALPYVPWRSRPLRRLLTGLAVYLAFMAISVVSHPTEKAIFEFFHQAVLYGGCACIGAAVANRHQVSSALKALLYTSAIVSLAAVFEAFATGFQPAYPFGINKNLAGSVIMIALVISIAAPTYTGIRWSVLRHLRVLLVVGLLATQCRGAGLALVAIVAIYATRHRGARRRAPIFFLTVSLVLIVVSVATLQEEKQNNPKFNSIDSRQSAFDVAIDEVWLNHPFTGAGLRYYQANDVAGNITAGVHNLVLNQLAEAGIVGMIGLTILLGNTFILLVRRRDPLGEAAFLVFVGQFLFGLTDVYWVAGSFSLSMMIVGLAVGIDPERAKSIETGVLSPAPT